MKSSPSRIEIEIGIESVIENLPYTDFDSDPDPETWPAKQNRPPGNQEACLDKNRRRDYLSAGNQLWFFTTSSSISRVTDLGRSRG